MPMKHRVSDQSQLGVFAIHSQSGSLQLPLQSAVTLETAKDSSPTYLESIRVHQMLVSLKPYTHVGLSLSHTWLKVGLPLVTVLVAHFF